MTDPILAKAPTYFASRSYQAPSNSGPDPPTKLAFGTSTIFAWLTANPASMANFASAIRMQQLQSPSCLPNFPFTTELEASKPLASDAVAIVDVGGELGQWLEQTLRDQPRLITKNRRVILQDLPIRYQQRRLYPVPRIEKRSHDFFTTQLVKGARYHHMRGSLHDWPDND